MFDFYLSVNRSGLITFCGVDVQVDFDVNGSDGKFGFREYDNGRFKNTTPISRHPNILKSVIIGKKGWGLLVSEWSSGIGSGLFTKYDFFKLFKSKNINIPESLLNEFNNSVWRERFKREDEQKLHNEFLIKLYKTNYGLKNGL